MAEPKHMYVTQSRETISVTIIISIHCETISVIIIIGIHCECEPVREAVSYRGLFTAGWFGVREKHCFRLYYLLLVRMSGVHVETLLI